MYDERFSLNLYFDNCVKTHNLYFNSINMSDILFVFFIFKSRNEEEKVCEVFNFDIVLFCFSMHPSKYILFLCRFYKSRLSFWFFLFKNMD